MKKCVAIVLALSILFSLVACGSEISPKEVNCENCGKGISTADLFCKYCGAGVTATNDGIETILKAPHSAVHYLTLNFEPVVSELRAAGFSNIQAVGMGDLTSLSTIEDGSVSEVSIDGNYSFDATTAFPIDAEVVVTYHSIPKAKVPISAKNRNEVDCDTLVAMFLDAGFINVTAEEVIDLDPDTTKEAFKNEVTIGVETQFLEGNEFPFDAEVSIVCHKPFVKHKVEIRVDFIPNLLFNKYDVTVLVDGTSQYTLDHGEDYEFELSLKEGTHTIAFQKDGDPSVAGKLTLDVKQGITASCKILCFSDEISAEKEYVKELKELDENGVAYSGDLAFYAALPDKRVCEDEVIEVTGEYTGKFIGLHYIGEIGDDFYAAFSFKKETGAVKQLVEGDSITIRGKCSDSADDKVLLNYCELISVTKSEPSPAPIPEEDVVPQPTPTPQPALEPNEAYIPLGAAEYVRKNYEEVIDALTSAGFSNIKATPIYDIYLGLTRKKSIKSISINGNDEFQSGDIFDKGSEIIIVYHMPYTDDPSYIKMPHESEYYDGMDYMEVEQQLKDLGFTNIDLDEMPNNHYEDGEVFSVLKGNHPFNEGDAIKKDEKITINYYVAEKPVVLETLTIDNNDQFAALMKITDQTDATTIRAFVNAHIGDIIEFDGCIAFMMNHGDYITRFDIYMVGGNYDSDKVYGPLFAYEDVAFYNMDVSGTDTVAEGMDFHITAEIKGYSSAGQYIILEPVSMKAR